MSPREFLKPPGVKKANATGYPEVFHRVGILSNAPSGLGQSAIYSVIRNVEAISKTCWLELAYYTRG